VPANKRDLTRTTLAVLFIAALILASLWIVRPFLPAVIWAAMIVIATWPIMLWTQARLWNSRALAVTVMVAALVLVLVLPLSLAIISVIGSTDEIVAWTQSLASFEVPPPPNWLGRLPLVGEAAMRAWEHLAALGIKGLVPKMAPYLLEAAKWLLAQAGGVGGLLLHFFLTVIAAAILYGSGERAVAGLRRFGNRLAGEHGEVSVGLAGQAIRSVALGVIVTAFVQSGLGGIGLAIAGVPYAIALTAVMFMLCIAQLGPVFVLLPAIVLMYWHGDTGGATFLLVWSIPVVILDNFLRPALIKRGADLPLALIFVGVIGGLIGFGLVGIFVGPVVLSVAYTLLTAWVDEQQGPVEPTIGNLPDL
jgi:predicted PurR-regulated permease PerM